MQIDRLYFPVKTLGYGNRIGIWTIGCEHQCPGCSNPELWEKQPDKDIPAEKIIDVIRPYLSECDGITLTGGDPFYQSSELLKVLILIKSCGFKGDVLVFTGYTKEQLMTGPTERKCLSLIDVLIDGKFERDLNNGQGLAGSTNQRILIMNKAFERRYATAATDERKSQIVESSGELMSIGIPVVDPDFHKSAINRRQV